MKYVFVAGLLGALATVCLALPVAASPSPHFQVKIFPLECNIDVLNTGVNEIAQLNPDDCLPKPPTPPSPQPLPPKPGNVPDVLPLQPLVSQRQLMQLKGLLPGIQIPQAYGYASVPVSDDITVLGTNTAMQLFWYTLFGLVFLLGAYMGMLRFFGLVLFPVIFSRFKHRQKKT